MVGCTDSRPGTSSSSTVFAIGVAGGGVLLTFVAWCLLATHDKLGNLLTFLAGGLFTVLSLGAAAVIAVFYVSEPAPALPTTSNLPGKVSEANDASVAFGAEQESGEEPFMDEARKQELRSLVIQELLQTSKRKGPPHQLSQHGEYSGWVWTMPESRYDKTEALLNWPPATEGPKAAVKWFGGLKAGRIFLARQTTLEDSDVVPVVEIPLAGCTVRLVTEGLRGKTRWWRKTPLEISHPSRALLARQKTFYLFCDGSAAKEQWFTALSWACSGGGAPKAVQDLYSAFCSALRDNRRLSFPQAQSQAEPHIDSDSIMEGLQGADGPPLPKKKGLFKRGWGSGHKGTGEKQVKPSKSKLNEGSASLAQKSAAFINPEDLDKLWMEAPKSKPAKQQQQAAMPKQAPQDKGGSHQGFVDHAGDTIDDAAAAGMIAKSGVSRSKSSASISGVPGSPSHPTHGHDAAGGAEAEDLVQHSGDSEASLGSPMSQHGKQQPPTGGDSTGQPLTTAIEHAINMLLARVAFDLLRSPKFKQQVVAHIQKKLDELKVPDYINALQVVDVDLGSGVPHISNLQALASPTATIWPQALFDLDFTGDIKLVIAAKVDVRDGLAWSSLDKYIKNIEGVPAGAATLQAHPSDPEAAAAATAAGMADSEEDAEATAGAGTEALGSTPTGDPSKKLGRVSQFLGKLQLRKRVAGGIRQLAEQTAQSISKMELKLSMDIKTLRGPLCVWLPPPPGDRMWFSFMEPPQLQVTASPLVAGRMVKYSYYIARISSFIASKMQSSVTKNLVFPSCGDIKILQLISLEDEHVTSPIPALAISGVAGASTAAGKDPVNQEQASHPDQESKKYGRTMSAGGTTTVVTPAPRSAASALSEAIAKGQAATAPVQTSAQSESLEGTAPDAPADHSGRAGQAVQSNSAADKPQGTVKTARADPNDPALHNLTDEPSGHSLGATPGSRGVSPRGPPSFTRGTSFSSTHGSPVSRSAHAHGDSFTGHLATGKDRSEHEGVELGTIRSSSQNLGEELLEQQLHSFAPGGTAQQQEPRFDGATTHAKAGHPSPGSDAQQSSAAQQKSAAGNDGNFNSGGDAHQSLAAQQTLAAAPAAGNDGGLSSSAQHKPVSFQSLAALASSRAAAKPGQAFEPPKATSIVNAPNGTFAADDRGTGEQQAKPQSPFKAASEQESDAASLHQGSLAQVATGRPVVSDSGITGGQDRPSVEAAALEQTRPHADPPAVLGRPPSEKKWAYPMPTGSPMFEKVRSRNYDQEGVPPSGADQAAPSAISNDHQHVEVSEQQPAQALRSDQPPPASEPTEGFVYEAPPSGPPQETPTGPPAEASLHSQHQTGGAGDEAVDSRTAGFTGSDARSGQQGSASPSVQWPPVLHEAAGSTASPKSWFGQQLKGNSGLASKVWDSKRDDIQQRGKKLASNVLGSFTRAEEKWRQSRDPSKK